MNKEELINNLPNNWSQITLNQYIKLIQDLPTEKETDETDNHFLSRLLSIFFYHFTGQNINDLNLNASDTMKVINKLNQFNAEPDVDGVGYNEDDIKDINNITYNEFTSLVKYQELGFKGYPNMINIMLKEPIEDVGDTLNMAEAYVIIELIKKKLMEYLNHSQTYLMTQMQKK